MYKVTRISMSNVGHELAWYAGIDVQLTDVQTGEATHTLYNLMNQGGKSTFLSMFFTVFDPERSRFLQHLRNNAQRFEQYFDKDGLPGVVAVEWVLPGDLLSERRLVTGLIVVMKKSGELFEPDRFFFCFESVPGLTYDDLPAEHLANGKNGTLENREDALRWLQQMETRYVGNFQRFSNQNEWKACLDSRGIDVEMLRRQVEFNRTEGGMGEAFLDFKTEYDFVRKFMTLTLNPEKAEQTHDAVSTLCTRMKGRAHLVESRQQLERFSELFDPFADSARDFHAAQKARSVIETALANAYATFGSHARSHSESALVADKNAAEFIATARKASELKARYGGLAEAYQFIIKKQDKEAAEAKELAAKDAVAALTRRSRLLEAARARAFILERKDQIAELVAAIELATRNELAPLRARRTRISSLLDHLYVEDIAMFGRRLEALDARAKELGHSREALKAQTTVATREREAALKSHSESQTRLAAADAALAVLVKDGTLGEFESCDEALARLKEAKEESVAQAESLDNQLEEAGSLFESLRERENNLTTEVKLNEATLKQLRQRIAAGDTLREKLANSPILCQVAGAELVDVDSDVLPSRLREFLRTASEKLTTAQLKVVRLQEDHQSIIETNLAGRDPDVSSVVHYLANAGVKGVRGFAHYLAEVLPDAMAARETVLSNPGRFLGVTVPAESIGAARDLLAGSDLSLIHPVVVSTYAVDPDDADSISFTVPAADDSAYNHAAARVRAQTLSVAIDKASAIEKDESKACEDIRSVQQELLNYLREFGNGTLESLKGKESFLSAQNETNRAEIENIGTQVERLKQRQTELKSQKRAIDERIHRLNGNLKTVQGHVGLYEVYRPQWEKSLKETEDAIATCGQLLEELDARQTALDEERHACHNETADTRREITDREEARKHVAAFVDAQFDAAQDLAENPKTFDALVSEWVDACAAVTSAEKETTAPLTAQLEAKTTEVRTAESSYSRVYPVAQYPDDEVAALLGLDLSEELAVLGPLQTQAQNEVSHAFQRTAEARTQFNSFVTSRKYPGVQVEVEESVVGEDLGKLWVENYRLSRDHEIEETNASDMAKESAEEAARYRRASDDFEAQREALRGNEIDFSEGVADPETLKEIREARDFSRLQSAEFRRTRALANSAREQCVRLHDRITLLARDEHFAKVDVELATMLQNNSVDATINDYVRLARAAENRRDTIDNELASMESDMARGTEALLALTDDGLRILARASDALKLPDSLPVFGGKGVIRMSGTVHRLTRDQRREALVVYMEELCRDGNIPESGAALTASCIQRLAPSRRLDLKVLKLVMLETQQYVPVDALSNSGAEKISMAMFLYFIIAKLRYEQRADSKTTEGGVLVLDNPFSTATARPIWETIVALADAMKIQLVLVTGIKEYEVLSVFKRFVRLCKQGHNTTKGRIHVGIADYQFKVDDEEFEDA